MGIKQLTMTVGMVKIKEKLAGTVGKTSVHIVMFCLIVSNDFDVWTVVFCCMICSLKKAATGIWRMRAKNQVRMQEIMTVQRVRPEQ